MSTSRFFTMDLSTKETSLCFLPYEIIIKIFRFLALIDLHSFLLALNLDKEEVYRQLRKRHDGEKIVVISPGDTSIGDYAFEECKSLTSVVIPNSVTSIGNDAFSRCSSLTTIVAPSSVISILDSVFSECSSLTSAVIPNSVTSIGIHAFDGKNKKLNK